MSPRTNVPLFRRSLTLIVGPPHPAHSDRQPIRPDYWARALPERVAADSIVNPLADNANTVNRPANNADTSNLGQVDMRRHRDRQAHATQGYGE